MKVEPKRLELEKQFGVPITPQTRVSTIKLPKLDLNYKNLMETFQG